MDLSDPKNLNKLLTRKQAAQNLGVSLDTLLSWENQKLIKPIVTLTGERLYSKDQLDNFINKKTTDTTEQHHALQETPKNIPQAAYVSVPGKSLYHKSIHWLGR